MERGNRGGRGIEHVDIVDGHTGDLIGRRIEVGPDLPLPVNRCRRSWLPPGTLSKYFTGSAKYPISNRADKQ
jgi:hypothetical protein